MADAVTQTGVAVLVNSATIVSVTDEAALRAAWPTATIVDCGGGLLTPGFVDSHTHAIFGHPRHMEQEMRATGVSYMEIAHRGGGIHASVRDLRARSDDDLYALAAGRLRGLAAAGVTTVEVKSGYGLSLEDEVRTLHVIRRLSETLPMRIVPTFLRAHEIPLEYRDRESGRREYVELLVQDMIPAVAQSRLSRFADGLCEPGGFTVAGAPEILTPAPQTGLGVKLHADELAAGGGAELAAGLRATSADHLAALPDRGHRAPPNAGTVST